MTNRFIEVIASHRSQWFSHLSFLLLFLAICTVVMSQVVTLMNLSPVHRTSISLLVFLVTLGITIVNTRWGITWAVFSLPFLPSATFQILIFSGYGRILHQHNAGWDLSVGLLLGLLIKQHKIPNVTFPKVIFPKPVQWVWLFLTVSAFIAVSRNLSQSGSPFVWKALFYNLSNIRSIGWHDDYRPLVDWVAYGVAFSLFVMLLPQLAAAKDRDDLIFRPLIVGSILAVIVGIFQNRTGIGLTEAQMLFRSDKGGFTALGFQPDIHAFAGQLMLGAIGLIGYVYSTKNQVLKLFIAGGLMPAAFYVIYLSKSKSNLALSAIFLVLVCALWLIRKKPYFKCVVFSLAMAASFGTLVFFILITAWPAPLEKIVKTLGFSDLANFNFRVAYRPEIFSAAVRMFLSFPLLGVGLGDFYRLAAIPNFSQSPFLSEHLNGENAHNYFLQTLVEVGALGFGLFSVMIAYPLLLIKNMRLALPALIGLFSIFLANLYSHSMLVRENLLVAMMILALLYAWLYAENPVAEPIRPESNTRHFNKRLNSVLTGLTSKKLASVGLISFLLLAAAIETYFSFKSFPFLNDVQCSKLRPLEPDGWTSGKFEALIPAGSSSVKLTVQSMHPDASNNPVLIHLRVIHKDGASVANSEYSIASSTPQAIDFSFPSINHLGSQQHLLALEVSRCFIPRNLGMNGDGRRLGVRLSSVEWH